MMNASRPGVTKADDMPSEIAHAGNTVVPASWPPTQCRSSDILKLVEARSWIWRASDDEIDATLGRYGLGT